MASPPLSCWSRGLPGLVWGVLLLAVYLGLSQAATTVSPGNGTATENATTTAAAAATTTSPAAANPTQNPNPSDGDGGTTTAKPKGFFDDNNNKAMFIVLPIMVLVYGGCASIYCFHKLCKSYRRYKRRKLRQQMHAQMEKEKLNEEMQAAQTSHANPAFCGSSSSITSLDGEVAAMGPQARSQQFKPYHRDGDRAFSVASPSGSNGKDDIIRYKSGKSYDEKEGYAVRNPGYKNQEEAADPSMGLIDIQLKEALAMIDSVVRKPMEVKSRPDLEPKENENTEPINRRRRMKKKVFVPQ